MKLVDIDIAILVLKFKTILLCMNKTMLAIINFPKFNEKCNKNSQVLA